MDGRKRQPVVSSEKPPEHIKDVQIIEGSGTAEEGDQPPVDQPQEVDAANNSSGNPVTRVDRAKAKEDLKQDLLKTYSDSYSTVQMLLDAGMKDYDTLVRIPSGDVSDGILNDLMGTYYPSFSTILLLYESNMKSYNELQN